MSLFKEWRFFSLKTLSTVALFGLGALPIAGYSIRTVSQLKIQNSRIHKDAASFLQTCEKARKYFGVPINIASFDAGNTDYYGFTEDKNLMWRVFHIKGPNNKGLLKYYYGYDDETQQDQLKRVEIFDSSYNNVILAQNVDRKKK